MSTLSCCGKGGSRRRSEILPEDRFPGGATVSTACAPGARSEDKGGVGKPNQTSEIQANAALQREPAIQRGIGLRNEWRRDPSSAERKREK